MGITSKITKEMYFQLIKNKFGDQFDYSKSIFKGMEEELEIGCEKHGYFFQKAKVHLRSKWGCPICGNNSKITKEWFIEEANKIHGENYGYDNVIFNIFTKRSSYVNILCYKHGEFKQTISCHLMGQICRKCCIDNSKKTTEKFIKECKIIHNDFYDYSLTEYEYCNKNIILICPNHGQFKINASNHLRGNGCKKCFIERKTVSKDQFLERVNIIHNNKYTYDLTNYKNTLSRISIFCNHHGKFEKPVAEHLAGSGCLECVYETRRLDVCKLVIQFNIIHNNKYKYPNLKENYNNVRSKITIECPDHGLFYQRTDSHLNGFGCQQCSNYVSAMEKQWIASLNIPNLDLQKYIFLKPKRYKVDAYDFATNTIYEFYGDYWHGHPSKYDPNKINVYKEKTFGELYKQTLQREVILKDAGYNIVSIWEHEWTAIKKSIKQ